MKKISIIIPVYNSEKYINRCIDSVLKQTMINDIEILLINDGSKDNSLNILNEYKEIYPDVIKVINQQNIGVSRTRNNGIKLSNGKYIMFIDNDDWIEEDYVEKYYNEIKRKDNDCIIGGYKRVDDNKIIFTKNIKNEIDIYAQLAPWAKIYKRDFLIKNNIEFFQNPTGEDVYFSLLIYNSTKKLSCLDYNGYNWYYNNESVSNTKQKKVDKDLNVTLLFNKINKDIPYTQINEYFFIRYIVWFVLFTIKETNNKMYLKNYEELFEWIEENFKDYTKNKYLKFKNNTDKKTLFIIRTILLLNKIKLGKHILSLLNKYMFHN